MPYSWMLPLFSKAGWDTPLCLITKKRNAAWWLRCPQNHRKNEWCDGARDQPCRTLSDAQYACQLRLIVLRPTPQATPPPLCQRYVPPVRFVEKPYIYTIRICKGFASSKKRGQIKKRPSKTSPWQWTHLTTDQDANVILVTNTLMCATGFEAVKHWFPEQGSREKQKLGESFVPPQMLGIHLPLGNHRAYRRIIEQRECRSACHEIGDVMWCTAVCIEVQDLAQHQLNVSPRDEWRPGQSGALTQVTWI